MDIMDVNGDASLGPLLSIHETAHALKLVPGS